MTDIEWRSVTLKVLQELERNQKDMKLVFCQHLKELEVHVVKGN